MEKILKNKKRFLLAAIITSVTLVISIPTIVLCAVNHVIWLLIIAIVAGVGSLVICMVSWMTTWQIATLTPVVRAVTIGKVSTIRQLALQIDEKEKSAKSMLKDCFEFGYLGDYEFDGDNIYEKKDAPGKRKIAKVCAACGAPYEYVESEQDVCPYCCTPAPKEEKK